MNYISLEQKNSFHEKIIRSSRIEGVLTLIATLITLFALTIIISSLVCMICFTGLNVIHQVILPALLPSCLSLICISLPIIVYVLKSHKETKKKINSIAQESFKLIKSFYDQYTVMKPDKNKISEFIETNIIDIQANRFYRQEFLQILKNLFPKKKNRTQEDINLIEGIDRSIENLKLSDKQKKERGKKELEKK